MRLSAYIWVLLRVALSFSLFAAAGAVCAFAYLAVCPQDGGGEAAVRQPSYSDVLADFLAGSSAEISLSAEELSDAVYGLIIVEARAKSENKNSFALPTPPRFSVESRGLRAQFPIFANAVFVSFRTFLTLEAQFDGGEMRIVRAHIGQAKIPAFAAERIARNLRSAYGLPESGFGKIKNISLNGDTVVLKK